MEAPDVRFGASPRRRSLLLVALALTLLGTASLAVVGEAPAEVRVASGGERSQSQAEADPSEEASLGVDPMTATTTTTTVVDVDVTVTTTTLRRDTTTTTQPPAADGPVLVQFELPNQYAFPLGLTAGPDGAVWFVESNQPKIGRITPAGELTEYALGEPFVVPNDITAGPDNALWFSDGSCECVGRITLEGKATAITTGYPSNGSAAIVAGPDGALWYTAVGSAGDGGNEGAIVRVTPAGEVMHFPLARYPMDLVVAGDQIYVATVGGVMRIDPAGATTTFWRLTTDSALGLAAAPDGTIWFTESDLEIAHVLNFTAESIEYVRMPIAGSRLAYGRDGHLWFVSGNNEIVRLSQSGASTSFAVAHPRDIAAGPDGNIWFTNDRGAAIGRIRVSGEA